MTQARAASEPIIANKHVSLCYHNAGLPRPQGLQLRLHAAACDCRPVAAAGPGLHAGS